MRTLIWLALFAVAAVAVVKGSTEVALGGIAGIVFLFLVFRPRWLP